MKEKGGWLTCRSRARARGTASVCQEEGAVKTHSGDQNIWVGHAPTRVLWGRLAKGWRPARPPCKLFGKKNGFNARGDGFDSELDPAKRKKIFYEHDGTPFGPFTMLSRVPRPFA